MVTVTLQFLIITPINEFHKNIIKRLVYFISVCGGGAGGDVIIILIIIIDIIFRDNEKGTCVLIHAAIPRDRNVIKKEAEKILKYKDLTTDIQRMWNLKTKVTPVKIGATGTISKSFRNYLSRIPGKRDVKELQKTAILGTAHVLRKVLM
jgi:hypothetical protein